MNVLCQDLRAGGQTDPVTYLQALRKGLQFILPEDEEIDQHLCPLLWADVIRVIDFECHYVEDDADAQHVSSQHI